MHTKNKWRLANIERKVNLKMRMTKEELEFLMDYHELPPGTCICQDKNDYRVVIDKTRCSAKDQLSSPRLGRSTFGHIRDYCNGSFAKR